MKLQRVGGTRFYKRLFNPPHAVCHGATVSRGTDNRYVSVTEFKNIVSEFVRSSVVVTKYTVDFGIGQVAVDQNDRHLLFDDLLDALARARRWNNNQAADLLTEQRLDVSVFFVWIFLGATHEASVVLLKKCFFDAKSKAAEKWVVDLWDKNAHIIGLLRSESPSKLTGPIFQRFHSFVHALRQIGADKTAATYNARHRGYGNLRNLGHLLNGRHYFAPVM